MYIGIFGGVFLFVVALAVIGGAYYSGDMSTETASLAVQAVGILGTVALAAATVSTVIQNSKTLREMQKERQKPIQTDVLRDVIGVSIERAEYVHAELDRGQVHYTTNDFHITYLPPPPVTESSVYQIFKENNPDLHQKLERWDDLRSELEDKLHEFEKAAWPQIPGISESAGPTEGEVVSILLDGSHERGPHETYRKKYENELEDIKNSNEYEEVQKVRQELRDHLGQIIDPLRQKKIELQTDFGVSEPNIRPHKYEVSEPE